MTPTLTAPDPAIFPEDVRRFAAERGVTGCLTPLYELTPRADRAHNFVYVRLNNCGHPRIENAAFLIHELRGLRNQADYDMHRLLAPDAVPDAIADAERILQAFDALSPTERVQITDGIK